MEANVAIHTPEKWAAAEACYSQAEKVKYIYGGRMKEREAKPRQVQADRPNHMKPSKSYDNELETGVGRDAGQVMRPGSRNSRDDSVLSYRDLNQLREAGRGEVPHPQADHFTASHFGYQPAKLTTKVGKGKDQVGVTKEKWRPKEKSPGRRAPRTVQKFAGSTQDEGFNYSPAEDPTWQDSLHISERPLPVENQPVLQPTPKVIRQRPTTLSPASPSQPRDKAAPLVILEVKDGPTFFYKPSERMVSDSETDLDLAPMSRKLSAGSLTNSSSIISNFGFQSFGGVSTRSTSSLSSAISKGSPSLLPRASGLRRPDLSVLKSPRASTEQLCHASSADSPVPAGNRDHAPVQKQNSLPVSLSSKQDNSSDLNGIAERAAAAVSSAFSKSSCTVTQQTPDSVGFLNTSEILQQKAGIKHDDIVVGPRRKRNDTDPGQSLSDTSSVKFDSFVGSDVSPPSSYLPRPSAPSRLPSVEGNKQRKKLAEAIVFPEQTVKTTDFKSSVKTVRSQEVLSSDYYPKSPSLKKSKVNSETSRSNSTDNSLERTPATGGSLDRGRWRPKEKKSGIHRPNRTRKSEHTSSESGYFTDKKPPKTSESPKTESENVGRYAKISVDTKHQSKALSPSPVRQQQLHSPSGARQKTKQTSLPSSKKQHPPSKLHMLSNIPVPMCHDPPVKRAAPPLKMPCKPTEPELPVEPVILPSSQCVALASQPDADGSLKSKLNSSFTSAPCEATITTDTTTKLANNDLGVMSDSNKLTNNLTGQSSTSEPQTPPGSVNKKKIPVLKKEPTASSPLTLKTTNNEVAPKSPALIRKGPQKKDGLSSNTEEDSSCESPIHAPAKPRLHRSAEHLGGAQLSIFNSTDNIQHFEITGASGKSFQDSAHPDRTGMDGIGPLKKDRNLAKIGILRRGSDRSEMCRRGSERAILPINDPSVEDLKKATSLKELCQSVASLLNIDNEKAAQMLTTSLSQRQDLVEGLDADAILDYLSHHGVLDPNILIGLDKGSNPKQRNSAILKHVEEHGNTAVALFINALRQSGQLHLASSLDTEQRIKPVSGDGYFGKDRHKGEVTVRVEFEALKILAPREPRTDKIVDTSLLSSPSHHTGLTPDEVNGALVKDDNDDDFVKPRSCWCFCFSRKSKSKRASSLPKKDSEKKKKFHSIKEAEDLPPKSQAEHEEVDRKNPNVKPHRTKSKEKNKKSKDSGTKGASGECPDQHGDTAKPKGKDSNKKSKTSKTKSSGKSTVPDQSDVGSGMGDVGESGISSREQPTHQNYSNTSPPASLGRMKPDKDSWDPIIMEYDPKLELVKLRAGQEELASPTRQYGQVGIMCEQWKSSGKHFLQKASQLCGKIIQELHTEIIKYFEQDRGTLVLDVISDGTAILIFNICMQRVEVSHLQQQVSDGSLISKMEDMFFSKVDITAFDIRGVKLKIVLDDQQVKAAFSELS
ncbi:uncharacterized protein LOC131947183 [Physella acuta]|uniref:uncharacterized protein LOC131947183 n=1 Tax=Physella acuta TaxID=109671 RepID=UPI0027DD2596|nr:uncharacterized protein LOC131947183 [Physella acuta]XP_059164319.1 uncharacterized protein LOC131947183 [Physella acuta]XP_059164325.1 uncharacterized protein LOC131947183 [Physella acuta]XP_059164332.1 uncharacterized protein LOC131947183 [Physella acuta]